MAYDLHGSWDGFTGHNSPLFARRDETGNQSQLNQVYFLYSLLLKIYVFESFTVVTMTWLTVTGYLCHK